MKFDTNGDPEEEISFSFMGELTFNPREFFGGEPPDGWTVDTVIEQMQEWGREEMLGYWALDVHVHVDRRNPDWKPEDTNPRLFDLPELPVQPEWIKEDRGSML